MDLLNQVGAGGLSASKLSLATATVSDVASGKTFYAIDKLLKTGTASVTKMVNGTFASMTSTSSPTHGQITKTINCGFKPVLICIYRRDTSYNFNTMCCICINGASYTTAGSITSYEVYEWNNKYRITLTDTGFIADNFETTSGDGNPFSLGTNYYYAVG